MLLALIFFISGCTTGTSENKSVPREGAWGIYVLDLSSENVELIYSTSREIQIIRVDSSGQKLAFSQKVEGDEDQHFEILTIGVDGTGLTQLTDNNQWDVYPCFSPDGTKIAFLSWRGSNFDIYVMNSDGTNQQKLYDSGGHDADIDWKGDRIAFTRDHQIWTIKEDGTDAKRLTNPPNAGQWGTANLPIGDYDPRFSPDGSKVAFERLGNVNSAYGDYDIYVINSDGSDETRLTHTGYSQGFAHWSNAGDKFVFIVSAIGTEGKYDIYMMNSDGSNIHDITPDYFPSEFLCHNAIFSKDDSKIYFIGQWYE